MGVGTLALTMTCLMFGQAGPAPTDVIHTNQRALSIPINIQDSLRGACRELLLYASWDQGRNYQLVATVAPDKRAFAFESPNDGVCWLKSAVINAQKKQEPENVQQVPPDLKVMIDTTKPVVRTLSAQRQGDDVVVAWEILEDNFSPQAFRLEYQSKDSPGAFWSAIPAAGALTGQKVFHPSSPGPLVVRLFAKDLAGNESVGTAEVAGGVRVAAFIQPAAPATSTNPSPDAAPPPVPPPAPPRDFTPLPAPFVQETVKPAAPVANTWAPAPSAPRGPGDATERLVASSDKPPPPPPPSPMPLATQQPANMMPAPVMQKPSLPMLHYVNQTKVDLEYEWTKVGKSGIGSVDLWWTKNDGQSWELYAQVPYDDVKSLAPTGKEKREVELPGEGVYGFTMIVKSKAGRGKAPPKPGDVPAIRFEVDITPPHAELWIAGPDPNRANALILKWAARDKNLHLNPITLEWAEKRDGEWNRIVGDFANSNSFSWQLPDNIPVQVYMRLRVRDLAGNVGVAVTQDPQLVDLSEPEGTLLNVTVAPR